MFVEVKGNSNEKFSHTKYPGKIKALTVDAEKLGGRK